MIDGLWVVQYEGVQGGGGAVLVFVDGQVLGGDNGFTIIGTYTLDGNEFASRLTVRNYRKSVPHFFEFEGDYDFRVKATVDGDVILGKAEIVDRDISGLSIKMTRANGQRT
jgi:hypothetical protein